MHIFFSWMPRPTHGVLPLARCRQRFVSPASWLRCGLTLGCGGGGVRCGVHTWPCWPVSRCAEGCCCVCKQLSGSGEIYLAAAAARGGPVPQRSFLQSWDIWALVGLCELAHSITYRVGAVEFQYNIFFLRCCKDIMQEGKSETQSQDPFHYSGRL